MSFLKNIMKRRSGSVKNPVKEQWRTRLGVENLEDRLVPALVLPTGIQAYQGVAEFGSAVKTVPATPSFTATAVSGTQVNLAWGSVAGASGYLVDEWTGSAWMQIGSLGSSATSDLVMGLSPGTTYYFDLAAYNSAGTTWANNYQSVTTLKAVKPAAPSFTATAVSGTQINLAWGTVAGASGYLVYEWTGTNTLIATLSSGTTSYAVTGLSPGTTYWFDLAAYNSADSSWANYQGVTTLKAVKPAAPSFTATAVSGTQINLAWNTVAGASGYLVYEWTGTNTLIATLSSGTTSYTVNGLSPGTTYWFDLAAYNSADSSWANYQGVTTLKAVKPAAPSFTATAVSGNQVNLAWGTVAGASGYLVYEWTGTNTLIATLSSGTTNYAVNGLSPGTTYWFDLAAYNSADSSWANYQGVTTLKAVKPAAPSFTATAVSGTQINLAWGTVAGASGYLVYEWTGTNTLIATLSSGTTSYAVTGLSPGTTYWFDLAAYNSADSSWANYQGATTQNPIITINPNPLGETYSPASGSLFGASGPSYLDVKQGGVGDCWLMASLAAVAARNQTAIVSMFTYLGTTVEYGATVGVYKVRFFDSNGVAQFVTVDTELPQGGDKYDHPNGIFWVALAEKAYVEANGLGFVTTSDLRDNKYGALAGGLPSWALQAITGKAAYGYSINPTNIASDWNQGKYIVLGSSSSATSPYIVGDQTGTHAYAVVGYNNSSTLPFQVYNPWGTDSSGWALGTFHGHQVYGLFTANAAFLSQNFASEFFGSSAAAGIGDHSNILLVYQAPAVTQLYSGMQPQVKGPTKVDSSNLLDNSSQEIADLRATEFSQWTPRLVLGLDEVLQDSEILDRVFA